MREESWEIMRCYVPRQVTTILSEATLRFGFRQGQVKCQLATTARSDLGVDV